ncbi:type I polyketide synthase [Rhodococcoides trifolii]|uniref:Type I polyketide synthase n=1 Tax=Rhodococcoides trifolii TaxID=908250 RepID=A0A917G3V4_9NOCA|nr:type I polyketide synthase [Rhodococcus trifolii]GGG21656.1 type I polyketide synthase [Rhodococcus trifolii]
MSIHEISTGTHPTLHRDLESGAPFVVAFGGQGSRWQSVLSEITADYGLSAQLQQVCDDADRLLTPVVSELLPYAPSVFRPFAPADETAPEASVPGILLAQMAMIRALSVMGIDATRFPDVRAIGHSQGCWGAAAWDAAGQDDAELIAAVRITVAAVVKQARDCGLTGKGERAPMVSVANIDPNRLLALLEQVPSVVLSIKNSRRRVVLSGPYEDLVRVQELCRAVTDADTAERDAKRTGGAPFDPIFEPLPIRIGFHHPALEPALDDVRAWSERCGLNAERAVDLARRTAVDPVDWVEELETASVGTSWLLDMGPDDTIGRLSRSTLASSGIGIVSVSTRAGQRQLITPGAAPVPERPWASYAPTLVSLPDGRTVVETSFTRLTGRSPILLAGMTPTTVDVGIVAAAANAGYWAELAGGGQVTEAILAERITELTRELQPGRAAQFNSMFLDPYLWKMQVGGKRMVPKARAAGAPIDGVVVTAGIPEFDDALALIAELKSSGIDYVTFKPGTVKQIAAVVAIAKATDEAIIVHVEGGRAGGHHSWEDLDDLLIATYQQLRAAPNVVLCVGGGIGTPERAADYLTGYWSVQRGYPAMPVDGILVGTAAMATLEATTSPEVKRLLMETAGSERWIGAGRTDGGMSSGRSQLGADIHETDNAASRCGRLLDEVAGDAGAVAARRDEIIDALSKTAKPYFGDVGTMTYEGWLRGWLRHTGAEKSPGALLSTPDPSWTARLDAFLARAEARLHPSDNGTVDSVLSGEEDPSDAVDALVAHYPHARDTVLHPADVAFFLQQCKVPGKPVPFVPIIDADVRRWWRSDSLWQAHDPRYAADQVIVIPGPQSVAGIDRVDEPVAELLGRFEQATVDRLASTPTSVPGRRRDDRTDGPLSVLLAADTVDWVGRQISNPVRRLGDWHAKDDGFFTNHPGAELTTISADTVLLTVPLNGRRLSIPITVPPSATDGGVPVVSAHAATETMLLLLEVAAGGSLPEVRDGVARDTAAWMPSMASGHTAVTAAGLADDRHPNGPVPDVVMGACWPAVFAVLGSAQTESGVRVIEGMLDLVHLDHTVTVHAALPTESSAFIVRAELVGVTDTDVGRVVEVSVRVQSSGAHDLGVADIATMTERFAIRGRVGTATLSAAEPIGNPTPRRRRLATHLTAPDAMHAFAAVSSDHNPIHTSDAAAALAGLDGPIVHGMWLSAAAQHAVGVELDSWTASFLAPVEPGARIDVTVDRVASAAGRDVLEVLCRVDGDPVMSATAVQKAPVTVYAFPGQGIQSVGMGQGAATTSIAAKRVWDRADAFTRDRLGFSILTIVRDNPITITVDGREFHHRDGVLFLTQFTQVAMATLGYAQIAELRENDAVATEYVFCGHSVGEFTALAAAGGIFDLDTVIELVYARGTIMSDLVERDSQGRSNYGMAAVRPNRMGLSDASFVADVAARSGEFLEVVNYNQRGAQYVVAGTVSGLEALEGECSDRAFVRVPGIDTPFHSSVLHEGVERFRSVLNRLVPKMIDADALVGRYIPNLTARPFALPAPVPAATQGHPHTDRSTECAPESTRTARTLLIDLLAQQLANPVRWIETQDVLFDELGVQRFVEVGVATAPTLANLARNRAPQVFNVERDRAVVFSQDADVAETLEPEVVDAAVVVETAPIHTTARPADIPFTVADAVRVLIATWTKVRLDQLSLTDTVESLCEGVSSRRNQLMLDLTSELGIGAIDGGADLDLASLGATATRMSPRYSAFGPVLTDALDDMLRRTLGPSGKRPTYVTERVTATWQLGTGWAAHVRAELALATREGSSLRGGALGTIDLADVDTAVDEAVRSVASRAGVAVSLPSSSTASHSVDSGALNDLSDSIIGADGILATTARALLDQLGLSETVDAQPVHDDELARMVATELGTDWQKKMAPAFDPRKAVLLDDRWATLREDLARIYTGQDTVDPVRFIGAGDAVVKQAHWYRTQCDVRSTYATQRHIGSRRDTLDHIATNAALPPVDTWSADTAVVTGASTGSIAAAIVADLLQGGATVIATTSRLDADKLEFYRNLYRDNAVVGAKLWVVPANVASYGDVDALSRWIGERQTETLGGKTIEIKPALQPTMLFPFAAPAVSGDLTDAGGRAEIEMRVLLWSVERMIATLSAIGSDTNTRARLHVVLPGSPNRGLFGGDGAYGEAKASLDAIVARWRSESWSRRVTLVHALIGWVSGTGLMGHNDRLVDAARERGVEVFTPSEMAGLLLQTCTADVRRLGAPLDIDLSGGLAHAGLDFATLAAESPRVGGTFSRTDDVRVPLSHNSRRTVRALPPAPRTVPRTLDPTWPATTARPEDLVVIVGAGEVGAYGSSRTRFEVEVHERLSAAGVVELAWNTGLIEWQDGWCDRESGEPIDEADIADRYHDAVLERTGIRTFPDYGVMTDNALPLLTSVFLDKDLTFVVGSRAEAESFQDADPDNTTITEKNGEWTVTRKQGTEIRVPRAMKMTRTVGAHLPDGFDPLRWGIPADMVDALDPVAVWNIVATVDAFLSSGFSPAELLQKVHPRYVANTQGTGQGAQQAIHAAYVQTILGEPVANDILQETLPNVIAAHVVQSYVGGYGAMVNPVGACASAAVSVEEGVDKIRLGKATLVVAGGFDDAGPQSILGFSNMSATADSTAMEAKGIDPRRFSRANDRRRAGFVEAQGGGTVLLARGDLALEMGLPVLGVVAWAGSFADGIHTSIPAPGIGALSAGVGHRDSELNTALTKLNLTADDIAVVSKHDTSTRANDPNEAEMHERLGDAIGRSEGNPLIVVSQKSLLGHGKGGAAAFQIIGLCQILDSQQIPPNRSLDCVDDEMKQYPHLVWPKRTLELKPRAGILTSLGFGHVSGMVVVAHADAFLAALTSDERLTYTEKARRRTETGQRTLLDAMCGGPSMYQKPDRPFVDRREVDMLLDPHARLGSNGAY